jgi:hypothetical protein
LLSTSFHHSHITVQVIRSQGAPHSPFDCRDHNFAACEAPLFAHLQSAAS